jgi:recombining binding protein (suppressor of hairless)
MLDYSSGMGGQPPPPPPPQLYGQHDVSGDAAAALDPRHAYAPQDPYAQTSSSQSHPSAQYTYGSYSHQSTPDLQRYRDNSSSSLSSHYGVAPGSLYPQPQFASSQSSFSSTASTPVYDLSSLSSFGNVKGPYPSHGESSLGYAAPAADPSSSLYPDHGLDRRGSNLSLGSNYDAGFQPDYGMYAPHGLQQPPRYTNEQGFEHSPSSADDIQQAIMPGVTNMLQDPVISYDMAASLSLSSTPDPSPDTYTPPLDAIISDTHFQQGVNSGDVEMFMRPILQHYVRAQNRLAFGERTIIVMSSKVAQKSYGTEKRYATPLSTLVAYVADVEADFSALRLQL